MLHRPGKQGLGRAYLAGFDWALRSGRDYTHVFEMDADLSHDPRFLGDLLQACRDGADLALGFRYVPGGGIAGWGCAPPPAQSGRKPLCSHRPGRADP